MGRKFIDNLLVEAHLKQLIAPHKAFMPYEPSGDAAYVRGNFPLPSPDHPDYLAIRLAFNMLDDLFFEILRTRNGACYSVRAYPYRYRCC